MPCPADPSRASAFDAADSWVRSQLTSAPPDDASRQVVLGRAVPRRVRARATLWTNVTAVGRALRALATTQNGDADHRFQIALGQYEHQRSSGAPVDAGALWSNAANEQRLIRAHWKMDDHSGFRDDLVLRPWSERKAKQLHRRARSYQNEGARPMQYADCHSLRILLRSQVKSGPGSNAKAMDEDSFKCPHCGNATLHGAHFCMRCGTRIDAAPGTVPSGPELVTNESTSASPTTASSTSGSWLAADLKPSRSAAPRPPAKPTTSRAPTPPARTETKSRAAEPKATTTVSKSPRTNGAGNGSTSTAAASKAPPLPAPPPPPPVVDPIDAGFDSILAPPGSPVLLPALEQQHVPEEPMQLFRALAVGHLSPVRDLLLELEWGEARREWLEVCRPAVAALSHSSEQLQDATLSQALAQLARALDHQPSNGKIHFSDSERSALEGAYAGVAQLLPESPPVDDERKRREPFIVQSVLQQVPGLGKLHIDRIYSAGVSKLAMLCSARADELASATGIPLLLAERVVAQFAYFRGRMASIPPDPKREGERSRLEKQLATLRRQNEALDSSAKGWSREARQERMRLRQERNETMLQTSILLARLGEVALLEKLEKLPFERKAEELEQLLQALQRKYERSS